MVYGRYIDIYLLWLQDGAPKIAKLVYKWLNNGFMVDITIVTGDYNGL